ncbi:MAG: hypothetical protein H6623_05350 [Bdellovibrionaceae bacterium]|nr:hypothetical protein [Pseudobdellovibrionaceae bacterium]
MALRLRRPRVKDKDGVVYAFCMPNYFKSDDEFLHAVSRMNREGKAPIGLDAAMEIIKDKYYVLSNLFGPSLLNVVLKNILLEVSDAGYFIELKPTDWVDHPLDGITVTDISKRLNLESVDSILELFLVVRRAVYELGPRDSCDEIYALPSYAGMLCAAYVDGLNLSRATAAVIDLAKKDPTISNAELEAFLKAAPQFEALIMEDFFEDLTVCDGEIRKVS